MIRHTMIVSCNKNGCRQEVVMTGNKISVRQLYKKVITSGWSWKNSNTQFCPEHRAKNKVKVVKVAKTARAPRAVTPSLVGKPAKVTPTKPAPSIPEEVATSHEKSGMFGQGLEELDEPVDEE